MNKVNSKRLADLRAFIKVWEEFASSLNDEFGEEIWLRLGTTVRLYRSEMNCLESFEQRDSQKEEYFGRL